jgi:hypothetical protein
VLPGANTGEGGRVAITGSGEKGVGPEQRSVIWLADVSSEFVNNSQRLLCVSTFA